MDDNIYGQVAIDAIRESTLKCTGFIEMEMYTDDDTVEVIEGLPSAQPRWIPVTERLPENNNALKRCPFCGAAAELRYNNDLVRNLRTYVVECKSCKAKIEWSRTILADYDQCIEDIIKAWNRRTHE